MLLRGLCSLALAIAVVAASDQSGQHDQPSHPSKPAHPTSKPEPSHPSKPAHPTSKPEPSHPSKPEPSPSKPEPSQPSQTGLKKLKHLIFFMQENRAFDHYYGTMAGVRGFKDPNVQSNPEDVKQGLKNVYYQSVFPLVPIFSYS
jgi:phospholipase C